MFIQHQVQQCPDPYWAVWGLLQYKPFFFAGGGNGEEEVGREFYK